MNTIFKHDDGYSVTTFDINTEQADAKDMFMHWVRFMNAIGYNLNPVEMEDMWSYDKESVDAGDVIETFLVNLKLEGVDHSNDPRFYKAELKTLNGSND